MSLKCNSGLDSLFIQLKKQHLLARSRHILSKFKKKYPTDKRGFSLKSIKLSAKEKQELKKISQKSGLVEFYPNTKTPKFIQFRNETNFLKKALKFKTPLLTEKCLLSITQKTFLYSSSKQYEVFFHAPNFPKSEAEWKKHSWDIISQITTEGTGQEKIGTFLRKDRVTINQNLLHKTLRAKVINQFIPISKSLLGNQKHSLSSIKLQFKEANLNGYKIDHKGNLYRQIANKYQIDNFLHEMRFDRRTTFFYQNKLLNKRYSNHSESQLPAVKEISVRRDAKKKLSKYFSERFGNENPLINAEKCKKIFYSTLETKKGERTALKTLYPKLENEIETLRKLKIPLNHNFNSKTGEQERSIFIVTGSFNDFTDLTFQEALKEINKLHLKIRSTTLVTESEMKRFRYLKKKQRQAIQFFSNSQTTTSSGWGIM